MLLPEIIQQNKLEFERLIGVHQDPYDLGVEIMRSFLEAEGKRDPGRVKAIMKEAEQEACKTNETENNIRSVLKYILEGICITFGIAPEEIIGGGRRHPLPKARRMTQDMIMLCTDSTEPQGARYANKYYEINGSPGWDRQAFIYTKREMQNLLSSQKNRDLYNKALTHVMDEGEVIIKKLKNE